MKLPNEAYELRIRVATWASSRATGPALAGSIWLRLARPGCPERPGSPWLARPGLEWLDLAALGALAASIWLPRSLSGALAGSTWLPETPWLALAGSFWQP